MTLTALLAGCLPAAPETDLSREVLVWGELGRDERGKFYKPRAMAIGPAGLLYIVDKTGRIQVFNQDGEYQRGWRTPEIKNGKPCGLDFDSQGRLLVADTHYHRVLAYTRKGELLSDRTIGGVCGDAPGEFAFITRAVEDSQGNFYIGEYGAQDRIQKFDAEGRLLFAWGTHSAELSGFNRPQALVVDENDLLWIADASNHRILVYDARGDSPQLVKHWGELGSEPGQLRYPWDIWLEEGVVYVTEFGNHRIQKFTRDGQLLESWGSPGEGPGQLKQPWCLVRNDQGESFVLDTYNHRVKRIRF